jgi:hypothetical protein
MLLQPEMDRLITLLDQAVLLTGRFAGGRSDHFHSAISFRKALSARVQEFKSGIYSGREELCLWFFPTYDWDDFTGKAGSELGSEIFTLLRKMSEEY